MQYYKTIVRLSGNPLNEVRKVLSAPEVLVLQYIHGVDALIKLEPCKKENIKLIDEKNRLKGLYDKALIKRDQSIDKIFGPLGAVPEELPEGLLEKYDIIDEDDVVAIAKSATKKSKIKNRTNAQNRSTQQEADRMETITPIEEISLANLQG